MSEKIETTTHSWIPRGNSAYDTLPLLNCVDGEQLKKIQYALNSFRSLLYPVSSSILISCFFVLHVLSEEEKQEMRSSLVFESSNQAAYLPQIENGFANSLLVVTYLSMMTFLVVLCYQCRMSKVVFIYLVLAAILLLGVIGGRIVTVIILNYALIVDTFTIIMIIWNFSAVGIISIYYQKGCPESITQFYLLSLTVLMSWKLSYLPEWTIGCLLLTLAFYDLFAVLTPCGPLKWLVHALEKEENQIPGMLYEAKLEKQQSDEKELFYQWESLKVNDIQKKNSVILEKASDKITLDTSHIFQTTTEKMKTLEKKTKTKDEFIRLGLGDFIFFSVLVAQAAQTSYIAMVFSFIAVIMGLAMTLILHSLYDRPLPALPISIFIGILFNLLSCAFALDYTTFLSNQILWT